MSTISDVRSSGLLSVSDHLSGLLCGLRRSKGITEAVSLFVEDVRHCELAVGMRFEDDVLSLFASRALAKDWACRLTMVVAHTASLAEAKAPGNWIGLGAKEDDILATKMTERSGADTQVAIFDSTKRSFGAAMTLTEWLESFDITPVPSAEFKPTLEPKSPESYQGATVRHKKFGEGRVMARIGDGANAKVKVAFPGHGLKLLAERFVEPIE